MQIIPLEHGGQLNYVAQIITGPVSDIDKERALIGINSNGEPTVPIEKVIVTKPGAPKSEVEKLKGEMAKIPSTGLPSDLKVYSPSNLDGFYEETNNVVFTLIRFVLNGTSIGVTLIYSSGVPATKAFIIGILNGSMSGALQYKVGAFRDWIRAHTLVSNFGAPISEVDSSVSHWAKKFYNYSLEFTEEFAKFGITEFAYTAFMSSMLYFLHAGAMKPTFIENLKSVVTVVSQSTFSQGTADLGLFKDLEMQQQYGTWSDYNLDFFRNAAAFAISALSVAVTAFQVANPGLATGIPLYFFNMPYGFALISVSGLVFYVHGLVTEWMNSPAPIHWIPLDFGD